jgi:hypothetical protein
MNRNKHPQKRRLTPFERETERRRRQMIRDLSGTSHTNAIPHRQLVRYMKDGMKTVMVATDDPKVDVPLYSGPRPNLWRNMVHAERRIKAVAA